MKLTHYVLMVLMAVATIGLSSSVYAYKEVTVSNGGTLTGTVKLEGQVPKPKGYNLTTLPDQFYCGRISDGEGWRILQPFNVGPEGEFRDVLVYLEDYTSPGDTVRLRILRDGEELELEVTLGARPESASG